MESPNYQKKKKKRRLRSQTFPTTPAFDIELTPFKTSALISRITSPALIKGRVNDGPRFCCEDVRVIEDDGVWVVGSGRLTEVSRLADWEDEKMLFLGISMVDKELVF